MTIHRHRHETSSSPSSRCPSSSPDPDLGFEPGFDGRETRRLSAAAPSSWRRGPRPTRPTRRARARARGEPPAGVRVEHGVAIRRADGRLARSRGHAEDAKMRKERGVAARGMRRGSGGVRAESRKPPRTETVVAARRRPEGRARRSLRGDDGGRAGVDVLVRLRVVVAGVAGVARTSLAAPGRGASAREPTRRDRRGGAARRARGDADVAHVAAHAAALVRTRKRWGGRRDGRRGRGSASAAKPSVSNSGFSERADEATGGVFSVAAEGSAGPSVTSSASSRARGAGGDREARLALGKDARAHLVGRVPVRPHPERARGVSAREETKRFRRIGSRACSAPKWSSVARFVPPFGPIDREGK